MSDWRNDQVMLAEMLRGPTADLAKEGAAEGSVLPAHQLGGLHALKRAEHELMQQATAFQQLQHKSLQPDYERMQRQAAQQPAPRS